MYQQYLNQAVTSLAYLSSDELKELLNYDDKLEERVNEVLTTLESEKDAILHGNRTLAEENLLKEPELVERRSRVNEFSDQGKVLCATIQEKLSTIKSNSGEMNQDTALALLQTAAAECEEESDNIVKQLIDKEITIDIFLDQFMTSRKLMHLRKLKSEKMTELIQRNTRGAGYLPNTGFYPGVVPYPTTAGSVPYPMGPMHMPMPGKFVPY